MDLNDLRSAVTLVSLLLFSGICAWAWRPGRQAEHDAAARLPFTDELADEFADEGDRP